MKILEYTDPVGTTSYQIAAHDADILNSMNEKIFKSRMEAVGWEETRDTVFFKMVGALAFNGLHVLVSTFNENSMKQVTRAYVFEKISESENFIELPKTKV